MDEKTFKTRLSKSSKDVLDFYDEYAETWDQRFGESESTLEFHRIRLDSFYKLAHLNSKMTAAELGVGTGPYVQEISPKVARLICVDGSKEMLNVLSKKTSGLNNIELKQIDLSKITQDLDFTADLVYFFGLIEHVIDMDNLIKNCIKILNPGGKIIIISSNAMCPWYSGLRKPFRAGIHCTTDKYYTRKTLGNVMSKFGFLEDQCIYWGFFPAGVKGALYHFLKIAGKIIEKTPLKVFGGGMTINYYLS